MKIGELAHASGTPAETIRFYEREGLLSTPERTEGNYRIYTEVHADRLGFIRQCRNLDMTLDEVRVLLRFKDAPQADCSEVNALLDEHIGHVAMRIHELRTLEKTLRALCTQCVHRMPRWTAAFCKASKRVPAGRASQFHDGT